MLQKLLLSQLPARKNLIGVISGDRGGHELVLLNLSIVVNNDHLSIAVLVLRNILDNRLIESISFVKVIMEYLLLLLSRFVF